MTKTSPKGPVVIDLEPKGNSKSKCPPRADPSVAPAILDTPVRGDAMQTVAHFAARKPSRLLRIFLYSMLSLIGFMLSIAFWDFITDLFTRNIWMGRAGLALLIIFVFCIFIFIVRELRAFFRLKRLDSLHRETEQLWSNGSRDEALKHSKKLAGLLDGKPQVSWALAQYNERTDELLDAPAVLGHAEKMLMVPLDQLARKEIERSARQVATATALVPMALLDVIFALTANVRMIRKIAEIYGGRAGSFGSWRLMKAVAGHLVATGAVAVGDDMLGSIAGGGVLSKFSRRFGEGVVNSALTARVGIATMEVCRPMPFRTTNKPKVTGIVKNALVGFLSQEKTNK